MKVCLTVLSTMCLTIIAAGGCAYQTGDAVVQHSATGDFSVVMDLPKIDLAKAQSLSYKVGNTPDQETSFLFALDILPTAIGLESLKNQDVWVEASASDGSDRQSVGGTIGTAWLLNTAYGVPHLRSAKSRLWLQPNTSYQITIIISGDSNVSAPVVATPRFIAVRKPLG